METEILDKLYLEISQFTSVLTKREISLEAKLSSAVADRDYYCRQVRELEKYVTAKQANLAAKAARRRG